mmetsp:Transcript_45990/g.146871  ORF Transcript_45990/g.146871 Transcript_45990/m.146871 type:complete len:201 (-) Transcript_45990:1687-2289(-)
MRLFRVSTPIGLWHVSTTTTCRRPHRLKSMCACNTGVDGCTTNGAVSITRFTPRGVVASSRMARRLPVACACLASGIPPGNAAADLGSGSPTKGPAPSSSSWSNPSSASRATKPQSWPPSSTTGKPRTVGTVQPGRHFARAVSTSALPACLDTEMTKDLRWAGETTAPTGAAAKLDASARLPPSPPLVASKLSSMVQSSW